GGKRGMIFTGNPNGSASDHGLVTDRSQVYATLGLIGFGRANLIMCGHFVSGVLTQNLVLELAYGGPAALRFYVCTGPDSGRTFVGTQADIPQPKLYDVIGMQHDGAGTYTMYVNNIAVGTPWTDTGALLTHGIGYRDSGLIVYENGFNQPTIGLGGFTALDYA